MTAKGKLVDATAIMLARGGCSVRSKRRGLRNSRTLMDIPDAIASVLAWDVAYVDSKNASAVRAGVLAELHK